MNNSQVVAFDQIRSSAAASISSSYSPIGGPFVNMVRLVCITNNTQGDLFFSTDGSTDMLFVGAGGFKLFDLNTNRTNTDQFWVFPIGTQFYVRYNTTPTSGAAYIECLWGHP
jgi:hypothetical protein